MKPKRRKLPRETCGTDKQDRDVRWWAETERMVERGYIAFCKKYGFRRGYQ